MSRNPDDQASRVPDPSSQDEGDSFQGEEKARRRGARAKRASRSGTLDVYGTVTGKGVAVSTEEIKLSVFDALS